jgi:hypothetical protein
LVLASDINKNLVYYDDLDPILDEDYLFDLPVEFGGSLVSQP